jgi:hypothetical protein
MNEYELVKKVVATFEKFKIDYFVTGGMAAIAYGEPRFTSDIDIVADLQMDMVSSFLGDFPFPDFYAEERTARDAVIRHAQFNILHPRSGLKIDLMILKDNEYDQLRMTRAVPLQLSSELTAQFATPEDVILKKLVWFQEGQSEKHLRDIASIILIRPSIDRSYLNEWVTRLGVSNEWNLVCERVNEASQ